MSALQQSNPTSDPPPALDLGKTLGYLPLSRHAPIWSQVYANLRDRIADLRLPPLYPLSEKDISSVLGVSRTPVREALIRLSEEGLVDIYPQYGTFVAPIRIAHLSTAQFIRESLEGSIIRLVAEASDPFLILQIERNIEDQKRAAETGDPEQFYELDEFMHQAFAEACGREAVWRFIQGAKVHVDRVRHLLLPQEQRFKRLVEEHEAILDGVRAGSPERAAAALGVHLGALFRSLPELQKQRPTYFEQGSNVRPARIERNR